MRVLIVNTSERAGGAAVAASRLLKALLANGVEAKMLVRDKESDCREVVALRNPLLQKFNFLWERLVIFFHMHFSKKHLFEADIANCGTDITRLKEFREADVIHLHWVNQGMLSLRGIRKIVESGKPVVWTMHDMWPATAICHITLGCEKFKSRCCSCRLLPSPSPLGDLSASVWAGKSKTMQAGNISFVACSKWLAGEAQESALLAGQCVTAIPNPIDTNEFHSIDKKVACERCGLPADKRVILFVSQRITNPNKGISYLVDACNMLAEKHPEFLRDTVVAVLGGHAHEIEGRMPFDIYPINYTSDVSKIADIYNAATLFVMPSLSENLPNTIMEAMACGVPCVGFDVGGIPEEIDHKKSGYVAAYRDAADLARGIYWVLHEADYSSLCAEAKAKVARCYSQRSVAEKYIELYNRVVAKG